MQERLLFPSEPEPEQTLLTSFLRRAQLYTTSHSYMELLDFVNRLPHLAPFNALLLNVQKPGLRFAASERDWYLRFRRTVREGARPLVILRPFGPVDFIFDVEDTEGDPLPDAVAQAFRASGPMTAFAMHAFERRLRKRGIYFAFLEYGDGHAGNIATEHLAIARQSVNLRGRLSYRIRINAAHNPNVQFATLVHELAHLYLGHLGHDPDLKITGRPFLDHEERELEAESLSYLVCHRAGVLSEAESYLAQYIREDSSTDRIDIYAVMRAAGQVETVLGIAAHSRIL